MVKIYLKNSKIITVDGDTTMAFINKSGTFVQFKRWKDEAAEKYELLYMIPIENIWYVENEEATK